MTICALPECGAEFTPRRGGRPQKFCCKAHMVKVRRQRGYQRHRSRIRTEQSAYHENNKRRIFLRHTEYLYGLTESAYDALLIAQSGRCAICSEPLTEVNVDHDHGTGEVRGLLCRVHNVGLGHFNDNEELLIKAALYLERYRRNRRNKREAA